MSNNRFIALLRGINVGGHKKIKMVDLRDMLASMGYAQVKTALASGNAAWDTAQSDVAVMRADIERNIAARFGFSVSTIVIPRTQIEKLVASDPFAGIEVTENTRLYVTFLPAPTPTTLEIPHHMENFSILRVTDNEVCSVLTLTPKSRTVDSMAILEDEFGKTITTRTWKTVLKLADL